jgi:HD-GYP domain-containing protein (c-di-GMP phosphodiesterase class II)
MDALIRSGKAEKPPFVPFLEHAAVRRDLLAYLREGPYGVILGDPLKVSFLMSLMGRVRLARPLLESLDFFRRNDPYTYAHVLKVFALTILVCQDLEWDYEDVIREATAGPLHDIGKLCVPLQVLRKTTPLRRAERALLEHHASAGFVLIGYYTGDRSAMAARVALEHHERRDGSGYPQGIPLTDRLVEIVSACDVYDALLSPRPFRKEGFGNRAALEELTDMAARGKIGWEIVQALVALNRKGKPAARECVVSIEKRGKPPKNNLHGLLEDDPSSPENIPA